LKERRVLGRQSGSGLERRLMIDEARLRQSRRCGSDERLRQMDQGADHAMNPVRRMWNAGRIVLVLCGYGRRMIAVHVRMGIDMRDMRMIVIRCVEVNVAGGHDELN